MTVNDNSDNGQPQEFSAEEIEAIAKRQKGLLICIALNLLCVVGQLVVPQHLQMIVGLAALLPIIGGAVFVCLLATTVYGKIRGVIFAILALVPLLGLIILLVVNGKATRVLKNADISVGLLGADLSEV